MNRRPWIVFNDSGFKIQVSRKVAKRIYVGNLSFDTTDEGLQQAFAQFGEVTSASVMKDKMTGRSRGFGFVEMAEDSAAASAIESMNGKELDGRTLTVNEARPMTDRPPRRGGFGGGGGGGGFNRGPRSYSNE